jgi:hypothetical protein
MYKNYKKGVGGLTPAEQRQINEYTLRKWIWGDSP